MRPVAECLRRSVPPCARAEAGGRRGSERASERRRSAAYSASGPRRSDSPRGPSRTTARGPHRSDSREGGSDRAQRPGVQKRPRRRTSAPMTSHSTKLDRRRGRPLRRGLSPRAAEAYDVVIRGGTSTTAADAPLASRRRDPRRPHRGDRRSGRAQGKTEIDARGLAVAPGLHQHAELGARVADRRRPRAERHPPGRDARGLRRGRVDGAAQRRDEATRWSSSRATSSTTSPGPRSASTSTTSSAARHLAQRRLVRRRDHGAHPRARLRGPRADAPTSWSACGRWCARRWKKARSASARR